MATLIPFEPRPSFALIADVIRRIPAITHHIATVPGYGDTATEREKEENRSLVTWYSNRLQNEHTHRVLMALILSDEYAWRTYPAYFRALLFLLAKREVIPR